jgi:hypothetical protein
MRARRLAIVVVAVVTLTAGCGDSSDPEVSPSPSESPATASSSPSETADASESPSPSPEPSGTAIDITFASGDVTPKAKRMKIDAGEPITLNITADEPGELHIHSSPEQELAYEKGTHSYELTIDRPGLVDVESHDLEVVIVQLEVS